MTLNLLAFIFPPNVHNIIHYTRYWIFGGYQTPHSGSDAPKTSIGFLNSKALNEQNLTMMTNFGFKEPNNLPCDK